MGMISCPKCGSEIEEGASVCPNCGCPVPNKDITEGKSPSPVNQVNSTTSLKKIGNIGGIISGIISVSYAFVIKGMDVGSHEQYVTYGGDAYTGIQNASAQAANNIQDLAYIVRDGLFAFLLVFGIALICFFVTQMEDNKAPVTETVVPKTPAATSEDTSPVIKDN
ncbi:zinc-ribbon domain-containing protein [Oribacterium sp. KHPX15]|uniref:zinc-ribbon domain-containing protein n=1 Tax=Oribacterium sp. KHPX15 TaxID=1855342 RepID=UPI00089977C4|nr:zinc-ribbon domain-containing protein [Oribacterium sp. KHPX15]SEA88143.1 zinc-ribbon domain-containing protein [Oribacterium sp. KHPX15]